MLSSRRWRAFGAVLVLLGMLFAPEAPAVAASRASAKFVVYGSGAGHGAGMSQHGAYALARSGSSAEQIIDHYYPGTSTDWANNNPRTVKVQVFGSATDKRSGTTLKVKGGKFTVADGAGTPLGTFGAATMKLSVKRGLVMAVVKKKVLKAARLVIRPLESAVATITGAHGSYHYGTLQATVIGSRLNVVNQVAMNTEYLYGVDEMPASWGGDGGAEALKAQAIVARTYVIGRLTNHLSEVQRAETAGDPSCDCHVYDDERSQYYTGWKKAGPAGNRSWRAAVDSTLRPDPAKPDGSAAQVVYSAPGSIAEVPYFASVGRNAGTGSSSDVFGTAGLDYLVSQADPYSEQAPRNPYLSWKRALTQQQVAKIFGVGSIRTIAITETYPGGLVKSLTATTTSGQSRTVTKTATAWMTALGVRSPWLTRFAAK